MEKSYRIKANVGKDQVLNVNLKRDVDLYEVLSLKLEQEKLYKLHSSNYGVIVGRVLANDGFGVPNAKVSVFIPISDNDKLRSDIKELYPYDYVYSFDKKNIRFNTLPDYITKDCYVPVGTLSDKRKILDNDVKLEIQDKYYKYTTITNNAGDYMLFGIPVGKQVVHIDIDLSDIGVLSQKPTDFLYKGYSIDMFESPVEFKKSTNLSELPQLISEDSTVNVYPFWGDKDENEIAITRKDVRIQYKFEPTCVFLGSVMTDSSINNIAHDCTPGVKMGEANQLVPSDGTIEMIRKTIDDTVEEFNIKGNQLIDGDGVWCYQIPMNLDYVCTDEYGNIVPSDNPNHGIPTRARVRFRVTLNETGDEAISSHKARYLIPNNPDLKKDETKPYIKNSILNEDKSHLYEFGTLTNDDCFRDLLWNKVYSVKSYIPRIQRPFGPIGEKSEEYLAIKGVNKHGADDINPIPYNKLNLNFSLSIYQVIDWLEEEDHDIMSFIRFWYFLNGNTTKYNLDAVYEKIVDERDGIGLDFYNDWLNGCLYFPNWHWFVKYKRDTVGNKSEYESKFCNCDEKISDYDDNKLCVLNNCSLPYANDNLRPYDSEYYTPEKVAFSFNKFTFGSKKFLNGIIKKMTNKDGADVYYYSFGQESYGSESIKDEEGETYAPYVRLFSTDIILLGSLDECDIHGIPKISQNLPYTTCVMPPMGRYKPFSDESDYPDSDYYDGLEDEAIEDISNKTSVNGMNWGKDWHRSKRLCEPYNTSKYGGRDLLSTGLFFGLTHTVFSPPILGLSWYYDCTNNIFFGKIKKLFRGNDFNKVMALTHYKSCINAERICELGVTNDTSINYTTEKGKNVSISMDGVITKRELEDVDTRAQFATLNSNKLLTLLESDATGYKTYNMYYLYPSNFDGRLKNFCNNINGTIDTINKDYLDFRLGSLSNNVSVYQDYTHGVGNLNGHRARTRGGSLSGWRGSDDREDVYDENTRDDRRAYKTLTQVGAEKRHFYGDAELETDYAFPLYSNSFYFYFGLNPAHTAIGEFYKNYMSKCVKLTGGRASFSVNFSVTDSDMCQSNGKINVSVNGATMPYSLILLDNDGNTFKSVYDIYTNNSEITDMPNGRYTLIVEDADGKQVTNMILMSRRNISLNYSTIDKRLFLSSYTINDSTTKTISFSKEATNCYNNVLTIELKEDHITIEMTSANQDHETTQFCNCNAPTPTPGSGGYVSCSQDRHLDSISFPDGTGGGYGNIIYFLKEGQIKYKITDTKCTENYSEGIIELTNN